VTTIFICYVKPMAE